MDEMKVGREVGHPGSYRGTLYYEYLSVHIHHSHSCYPLPFLMSTTRTWFVTWWASRRWVRYSSTVKSHSMVGTLFILSCMLGLEGMARLLTQQSACWLNMIEKTRITFQIDQTRYLIHDEWMIKQVTLLDEECMIIFPNFISDVSL